MEWILGKDIDCKNSVNLSPEIGSETFPNQKRIHQNAIGNWKRLHRNNRNHYRIWITLEFSIQIFKKFPILNFTQIWHVGSELFHANIYICAREDRYSKLLVNFRNFHKSQKSSIKRKFTQALHTAVFVYRRTHTDSSKRK